MAWSAPMTAVANTAFTAAQFNTYVRDNLLETAPAKATTAGSHFVATAANAIAERTPSSNEVLTSQSTSNTSFTNLATTGPAVTATTGTMAYVEWCANISNNTINQYSIMGMTISGATTLAADDTYCLAVRQSGTDTDQNHQISWGKLYTGLTPGSNVFTAKYRVTGGTGTFLRRVLTVIPF